LDYRQLGRYGQVLGAGTGSPNAALLPVSHNRTGKVYLAVVAARDITAGTEFTFDCGTASYASGVDAVLRCCLSNSNNSYCQQQQQEKVKTIRTQTEQQQQDLPVCPVPAGNDVPAGKLHKSLMSQLLAALATCRKLPASSAQRTNLDKLLQQAVTLAHEAVVEWSSAAAAAAAVQQQQASKELISNGTPAAAAAQKDSAVAQSSVLSDAASTPHAPRTPTFGGFLEAAAAATSDSQHQQQQRQQQQQDSSIWLGAAAAPTAAGEVTPLGIQLSSFGSAGSYDSMAAAAVRPSRWSHSISAAVEVPAEWQQGGEGEADDQQQQQPAPEPETSLLDDEFTEEQQQQLQQQLRQQSLGCAAEQQQGVGCEGGDLEGGEVCAGSMQANIQPLVRQLIR
jgi:hypothetical protein